MMMNLETLDWDDEILGILDIPRQMQEMNYGCGTTVHLQDLSPDLDILYVGAGGGLEAL